MEFSLRQRAETSRISSAVLTVAGSDSSGGAGIEADLKTFSAHHVYGVTCITALTAQNSGGIRATSLSSQDQISQTLAAVLEEYSAGRPALRVVKTGMLSAGAVAALAGSWGAFSHIGARLVVDPVMVSTSGVTLASDATMQQCMRELIPHAFLCTPNMEEAVKMGGCVQGLKSVQDIHTVQDAVALAVALRAQLGCQNLLLKGGHVPFDGAVVDVLVGEKVAVFTSDYIQCANAHGTGCTLASAIAANLSKNLSLVDSVKLAIDYIHGAMSSDLGRLDHGVWVETDVQEVGKEDGTRGDRGETRETSGETRETRGETRGETRETKGETSGETSGETKGETKGETSGETKGETRETRGDRGEPRETRGDRGEPRETRGDRGEPRETRGDRGDRGDRGEPEMGILHHLKSHRWTAYTHHPILASIATDSLPKEQFLYFLKQDYFYLQTYAQMQGHAIAVAKTLGQIQYHTEALGHIMQELSRHRAKFSGPVGERGPACVQYTAYLRHIGSTEDILGICVALAPCLHGYAEAAAYCTQRRRQYLRGSNRPADPVYSAWLADYTSEWYTAAHVQGMHALDEMFRSARPDAARRARLREIFDAATALEIGFWDEVMTCT